MTDLGTAQFWYRFTGTDTNYGPRELKWIEGIYGDRTDCSLCPNDQFDTTPEWLPVQTWIQRLRESPLTERQAITKWIE